jgi:hypothetical protein
VRNLDESQGPENILSHCVYTGTGTRVGGQSENIMGRCVCVRELGFCTKFGRESRGRGGIVVGHRVAGSGRAARGLFLGGHEWKQEESAVGVFPEAPPVRDVCPDPGGPSCTLSERVARRDKRSKKSSENSNKMR